MPLSTSSLALQLPRAGRGPYSLCVCRGSGPFFCVAHPPGFALGFDPDKRGIRLMGKRRKEVLYGMPTYIMLSRVSPEGLTTLKRNPSRLKEVNQEVEQFGARVVQQYALLGSYDFITVLDAPDAETVARISVELGSRGTASYETLTAIPVDEFISSLRG